MGRFARISLLVSCSAAMLFAQNAARRSSSLAHVPPDAKTRSNPFSSDPQAPLAGAELFAEHCAQCHGQNAEGLKGPSLRSRRIHQASPGELEWLLQNGILPHGMPSWSRLPAQRRWQIVTYLKKINRE